MKPTVHDIAKEAGVSLATVDRVLNGRPGVRERTVAKVRSAVERLGYVRDTSAANLARQRRYNFAIVLPEGPSQFVDTLRAEVHEACRSPLADRMQLRVLTVPATDPHVIVRMLRGLDPTRLDGVAMMVPETPQVRDAVARLKHAGLAVVTLVADLPNSRRDYFIGINSVAAGRTAGLLMGRFVRGPGDIVVATNSMRSRDSLERRLGFDTVIAADFPDLRVLPSVESHDDPQRMAAVIEEIIRMRPALKGVYSMGPGNQALLQALRRSGRLRDLVVIAHELTPVTHQALLANEVAAVIAQNVGHLVRSTLRVLRSLSDGLPVFEAQERVRIDVVLRENMS